jgi:Transglycosylase SLT domain
MLGAMRRSPGSRRASSRPRPARWRLRCARPAGSARLGWCRLLALLALILVHVPVAAVEVQFPLTVDYEVVRAALRRHLRDQGSGALELWRTADGCGSFVVRDPVLAPTEGARLRISGPASARAGMPMLGWCFASVAWDGHADIIARPELDHAWQLRFRDLDFQLYDAARRPATVATRLWTVVRDWSEAELATFSFDLGPPVEDVRALLRSLSAPASPLQAALQTIRPLGLAVEPDALRLRVAIDVPPAPAAPPAAERALSAVELRRWETTLDHFDAFLAFLVKDLTGPGTDAATRNELLDVLLTARRDLLAILGRGPEPGVDPIRPLFLSVWERLRSIVRRAVTQGGDDARSLRYVVFLAAGDALTAVDAVAPAAGLDFSSDGLRRLARTVAPAYPGDPLEYSEAPDARLQEIFRFRDPDAPPRRLRRKPAAPRSWLAPRLAHADEADEWRDLNDRLDRWVPAGDQLDVYRDTVDRLLALAAERSFDPEGLDDRYDHLFRDVVKAVAWQESCWRQFVRTSAGVVPIQSSTGDVGMMQINVRVWRGFFSPAKLRWSAGYNAGAGAEILWQLLVRYGMREGQERLENAARATYSAYHGGPARYRRYRTPGVAPQMQAIDRAFWDKYRLVSAGQAHDRVLCMAPARRAS